ncbi:MAG: endonuclease domain-containing protein [Deltaproteobacteria bacterium]|jgi:very-short-patch-repair endonuclease|nr:endonuclease domain-containing protein [Deltaproteobacteria bacterium]
MTTYFPLAFYYLSTQTEDQVKSELKKLQKDGIVILLPSASAESAIHASLEAMALKALEIWPEWFNQGQGTNPLEALFAFDTKTADMFRVIERASYIQGVDPDWLKKAVIEGVSRGNIPFFAEYPNEIQARQLTFVLGNLTDTLALILPKDTPGENLASLTKSAFWLQRETGLKICLFVPEHVKNNPHLLTLSANLNLYSTFGSHRYHLREKRETSQAPALTDPVTFPQKTSRTRRRTRSLAQGSLHPFPTFQGKPNPKSPGELLLSEEIDSDRELAQLFKFNQEIHTTSGPTLLVDLLWEQGKLVVEVDGFKYHGTRQAFESDRHRDYLLMLSGYRVLRITYSEIRHRILSAMDKIKKTVAFIKSKTGFNV